MFIILAFIAMPVVMFAQDNDFEIVEAGQKPTQPTRSTTQVKSVQNPPATTATPTKNQKIQPKTATKRGVAEVQNAQMSVTGILPLRVEVSDQQPNALITLAVGAATRFHSEEKPTRLVIGNLTDIGVTKAGSQGWYGFYLRPVNGGITTNMFIEFASGATVMINIKTVNPKTLKPGDYNSEVFVKTAAVRDELISLRKDNDSLKTEIGKLKVPKECPVVIPPTNISDEEMFRFLDLSVASFKRDGANVWKPGTIDKMKVSALTPLWEMKQGLGYVLIEFENRGKVPVTIQSIELSGAKAEIKKSTEDLVVAPNKSLRFAIKIELKSVDKTPLSLRFTTTEGKFLEQTLFGFGTNFKP